MASNLPEYWFDIQYIIIQWKTVFVYFYAIQPNGIVISNNPLLTGELQWSYKHK